MIKCSTKLKGNTVLSIIKRTYQWSPLNKCESGEAEIDDQSKNQKKHTAIRKILRKENGTFTIIQTKSASNAMRKLNWENKNLYGSVISDKPTPSENRPFKNIIQHAPEIVVKENIKNIIQHAPEIFVKENIFSFNINKPTLDINVNTHQSLEVGFSILDFPLLNKFDSNNLNSKDIVIKANLLREHLKTLCGNNRLPSVTSILEKTMPPERVAILERWKQNMIKHLGVEGFEKYKQELFSNGSSLHSSINNLLSSDPGTDVNVEPANMGHWKSLKGIFPHVSNVKLLEEFVTHPFLLYRGVIDCFATYRDHLVVIDWKTSKKKKVLLSSTYDNPLQIAAYVGALNFDPKFQYMVKKGLIVVAYEDGSLANAHLISEDALLSYWKQWLDRLKLHWETVRKSKEQLLQ